MKLIEKIMAICSLIGIVFTIYNYSESRYALASNLVTVSDRLDHKILSDRLNSIQEREWKLDDRFDGERMPEIIKEEYRKLKEEEESIKKKIDKIR